MATIPFKKRKFKIALVLTCLIIMIFGKNILERQNFSELGNSFVSFYEDRLVVEGYIFSISEELFRIKLLVNHCAFESDYSNTLGEITKRENDILRIVEEFEQAEMTNMEVSYLADFKKIIQEKLRIADYALLYSETQGINVEKVKEYNALIERALVDLEKLSQIQLEEGAKIANKADKTVNKSKIWAQFEVAALVIIMVIIYLLIYKSPSVKSEFMS